MEVIKEKNWVSIIIKTVLAVFFMMVFLFALLHAPFVQERITKYILSTVISKSDGKLQVAKAEFNIYKGVTLGDVIMTDLETDTLLRIESLKLNPKSTLLSFISGDLKINDLSIHGVDIFVRRGEEDNQTNWERIIASFSNGDSNQSNGKPPVLDLSRLVMSNVKMDYNDLRGGLSVIGHIDKWELQVDQLKFGDDPVIALKSWVLNKPELEIYKSLGHGTVDSVKAEASRKSTVIPKMFVDEFNIINGSIQYTREDDNNVQFREFTDLDIGVHDVRYEGLKSWAIVIDDVSGYSEQAEIKHFRSTNVERKDQNLVMDGALLRTNHSLIRFDASFDKLDDLLDPANSIIELDMGPSFVRLSELYGLIPVLSNEFKNEPIGDQPIQLRGDYYFKDDKLSGRNIDIWINSQHHFTGDAAVSNIKSKKPLFLDIKVADLQSDIEDLAVIYSKIPVVEEFKRMGQVNFKGQFNGFLSDFKSSGKLHSDLGGVGVNVLIKSLSPESDSISYSGLLQLDSFDLGGLLMDPNVGVVTASLNITNGRGVDIINSEAELEARIAQFVYRDFMYSDAIYEGRLNRRIIDGKFQIKDKNLDFAFSGLVDLSKEEPIYDFTLDAQDIDFCQLNLVDFPCHLSFNSEVNFKGKTLRSAEGASRSGQIVVRHDSSELKISNLEIVSQKIEDQMRFSLRSDFVDFDIEGDFHLLKLYQLFLRQMVKNHPGHNRVVQFKDEFGEIPVQDFTFNLTLKDANALFDFLNLDLEMEDEAHFTGFFDRDDSSFVVDVDASLMAYKDIIGDSIRMKITSADREGEFVLDIKSLSRNQTRLSNVAIRTDIMRNRFDWAASYVFNEKNRISVAAQSLVEDDGYYTRIIDHDLWLDSTEWTILPNRGVGIYKKEIDIENFEVTDGSRYIAIKDIDRKGLEVSLNDFNFEIINPLINYDKLYFTGSADSKLRVENIFEKRSVQGYLDVPDFAINGDDYGNLLLRANQAGEDVIDLDLRIIKDTQELYTRGYINTSNEYVNVDLTLQEYPMNFFEYIIEDGISETEGTTNIEAKIYGTFDDMKLSGLAEVNQAGVRIDYLGTFYRMENEKIKIDENFIDLNGVQLIDARENRAVISGGLRHQFLGDFRTDLTISSPEFIALSTTNLDNPLYYGIGNGDLVVRFDGPFDAVNMRVTATTGPYTQLFIPITSTQYGYDESFIKFDYDKSSSDSLNIEDLVKRFQQSGVDFEMNLTFTPDAEVSVIYDESTSNVLEGRGRGNLSIKVKRDGEFSVYGNYDIEEGEYRYTAYGFIAKPFIINRGGRVSWTGDPINANLEVTAGYAGLRAPLNVFLQEYIESSTLQAREFSQRREVDLTLLLTGTLFDPEINFDIGFPNLTGELKTLADSKVRALESTENGINNQVVGLLVFRNFLPDNNPFASLDGSTLGQSGNNTITEFLTSQLSLLFSDYLSEKLKDNGFIEGIDFEIAVAQNTSVLEGTGQDIFEGFVDFVPDEVQLNLRNRFKNDNLVLSIGGNYVRQSEFETAQDYLTGDFALDWFISDDKRLKLRFYGNYDYDEAWAERKQKYGFGISYRREFGKISNFRDVIDNVVEEINRATGNSTSSNQ